MHHRKIVVGVVGCLTVVGCRQSLPGRQSDAGTQGQPSSVASGATDRSTGSGKRRCGKDPEGLAGTSSRTPHEAFLSYADALRRRDWCDVIRRFTPSARPGVAVASLKSLVVMAAAQTPNRAAYRRELEDVLSAHGLARYRTEENFLALALDVMNRRELPADVSLPFRKAPAETYASVMEALARTDSTALPSFEDRLEDVVVDGSIARAKAVQNGGRTADLRFIKGTRGWSLTTE